MLRKITKSYGVLKKGKKAKKGLSITKKMKYKKRLVKKPKQSPVQQTTSAMNRARRRGGR